MQGVPVTAKGDPLRRTYVVAGNYQQFCTWCAHSAVNVHSRDVYYVAEAWTLCGVHDIDVVYTGEHTGVDREARAEVDARVRHLEAVGEAKNRYDQYEQADITPNVVDLDVHRPAA